MNQTKKEIKDFLISKDIKFSSIFEIDKLPGGSSNETWIIKYKNDSIEEKIVLRRHFQGMRNIDNQYPPLSLKIESDVMKPHMTKKFLFQKFYIELNLNLI